MVYTETKERNGRKYYYRVASIRQGKKVSKKRKYLGKELKKQELQKKEKEADKELLIGENNKINKNIKKLKLKIVPLLKRNKVRKAGIFGSYARGEQRKDSDIDILIEVKGRKFSLLDLIALERELKKKLGIKVDLLTYKGIYHLLRERILNEEIRII